jgi:membrane protein DedA with SNARE-associated domain
MFSFIASLLVRYGLGAVAALMLVENLIPIIPSELILPFVGFEAAGGRMPFALAFGVASVSSTIGGLAWYALGRGLGLDRAASWAERHGAWTTLNRKDIEMGCRWFKRWGGWAVMVGRALPGIRSFIPVPAGIARQGVAAFLAWSGLGGWRGPLY